MPSSPFSMASYPRGMQALPDICPIGRSKRIGKLNSFSLSIKRFFNKSFHSGVQISAEKLPNPIPAILENI